MHDSHEPVLAQRCAQVIANHLLEISIDALYFPFLACAPDGRAWRTA